MLKRMIVTTALFAAVCQPAFAVGTGITGVKDSADFAFKYEADVLPDAAGFGFVLNDVAGIVGDTVSVSGGILTFDTNNNASANDLISYDIAGGAATSWDPHFSGDYTVEIRAKVRPANFSSFGFYVGARDVNSAGNLSMFEDSVRLEGSGILATAANDDAFHVFRLTSIADGTSAGQRFRLYRDGVQIGIDNPSSVIFAGAGLRMGDFISGGNEVDVDVDYLRWDTTGAWIPVPEPTSMCLALVGALTMMARRRSA